jgi:hypothetical protein
LSAAHILYIPLCIFAGVYIGWRLGARSSRAELARQRALLEEMRAREARARLELSRDAEISDPSGVK